MVLENEGKLLLPDGTLNQAWIDKHNAKVEAFWAGIMPLVEALTVEQCEAIHAAGFGEGLSMNRIGERFREQLGGKWSDESRVAVGEALYRQALVKLDKYDSDFRPRPERVHMGDVGKGKVYFLTAEYRFEVVVGKKSQRFKPCWNPRFGMDVEDVAKATSIAEKLSSADDPRIQ